MSRGYVYGSFDLLHVGRLGPARERGIRCDQLVVGVLSDEAVEVQTGAAPFIPHAERVEIVAHLRGITDVRTHTEGADLWSVWRSTRFDVLFVDPTAPLRNLLESTDDPWPYRVEVLPPATLTASEVLRGALGSTVPRQDVA